MKYFVMFFVLVGVASIPSLISDVFSMCVYNEDWPDAPCYDQGTPTKDELKVAWAPYYDYKGTEWMEKKKTELVRAILADDLEEWSRGTGGGDLVNWNIYKYYSVFDNLENFQRPLHQIKHVDMSDVRCFDDLVLIQKYDGTPACVKFETVSKLVTREWGTSDNWIKLSNAYESIHYELDGGKFISADIFSEHTNPSLPEENKQTWLQIKLESIQDGSLQVTLPRNLIDSKINDVDDDFFVLLDGAETEYLETKTESDRILTFSIPAKTDVVEILGYGHYNPEFKSIPEPEPIINEDGTISENTKPYTWYDVSGIKQIYEVGEPITFTETVQGYDNPCVFPHYEILDGNTLEPVWEYKTVFPCPFIKDPQYFKQINTIPNENIPSLILNQTGPYILRSYHSYSDGYSVVTFSVVDDSFVRDTIDPCNVVYDLDANDLRKRTAPPTPIREYGRDATLMEPFVFDTSVGELSIPSYMPSCYELKSDKIKK